MDGKMKVAVMTGIGKMGFEERDIPKPAADEVLVKLEYVGICGSDMHYLPMLDRSDRRLRGRAAVRTGT